MAMNELKNLKVKGLAIVMQIDKLTETQQQNTINIRKLVEENHQMGQEKTKLNKKLFGLFKE